jgi:hypothetical protein
MLAIAHQMFCLLLTGEGTANTGWQMTQGRMDLHGIARLVFALSGSTPADARMVIDAISHTVSMN